MNQMINKITNTDTNITDTRDLSEATCCALLRAALEMDWTQVHLHGGEPCFDLMPDGRFCGRSNGWHEKQYTHAFVSLYDFALDVMTRPQEEIEIPEINHAEAVAKILSHNVKSEEPSE